MGRGFEWVSILQEAMDEGFLARNDENTFNVDGIFNYSLYLGFNTTTGKFFRLVTEREVGRASHWPQFEGLRAVFYYYTVLLKGYYGFQPFDLWHSWKLKIKKETDEKYGYTFLFLNF